MKAGKGKTGIEKDVQLDRSCSAVVETQHWNSCAFCLKKKYVANKSFRQDEHANTFLCPTSVGTSTELQSPEGLEQSAVLNMFAWRLIQGSQTCSNNLQMQQFWSQLGFVSPTDNVKNWSTEGKPCLFGGYLCFRSAWRALFVDGLDVVGIAMAAEETGDCFVASHVLLDRLVSDICSPERWRGKHVLSLPVVKTPPPSAC